MELFTLPALRYAASGVAGLILSAGITAFAFAQSRSSVVGDEASALGNPLIVDDCVADQACKTHELKTSTLPRGGTVITLVNRIGREGGVTDSSALPPLGVAPSNPDAAFMVFFLNLTPEQRKQWCVDNELLDENGNPVVDPSICP